MVVPDFRQQDSRDLCPVQAAIGLPRNGIVSRHKNEPKSSPQLDRQLALSITRELMATMLGQLRDIRQVISRIQVVQAAPEHVRLLHAQLAFSLLVRVAELLEPRVFKFDIHPELSNIINAKG